MKRRRKLRVAGLVVGVVLVLIVGAYFLVTQPFFIKGVILPRVEKRLGTPLKLGKMELSPFSSCKVRNVRVGEKANPLFEAGHVNVSYELMPFLWGKPLVIHKVGVQEFTVKLRRNEKGTWNLPGAGTKSGEKAQPPSGGDSSQGTSSMASRIHLEKMELESGEIQVETAAQGETPATSWQISPFSLSLNDLRPGQTLGMTMSAQVQGERGSTVRVTEGKLEGEAEVELGRTLLPGKMDARFRLFDLAGHAGELKLGDNSLRFRAGLTPGAEKRFQSWNIDEVRLEAKKGDSTQFLTRITGKLSSSPLKVNADITTELPDPDFAAIYSRMFLAPYQVSVQGNNECQITLTENMQFSVKGNCRFSGIEARSSELGVLTPAGLELESEYTLDYNLNDSVASIKAFSMQADAQQHTLVKVNGETPLTVDMGGKTPVIRLDSDKSWRVQVPGLDLQPFKGLLPADAVPIVKDSTVYADIRLAMGGKKNVFEPRGNIRVSKLHLPGIESDTPLDVANSFHVQMNPDGRMTVSSAEVDVGSDNKQLALLKITGGSVDLNNLNGRIEYAIDKIDESMLSLAPDRTAESIPLRAFAASISGKADFALAGEPEISASGSLTAPRIVTASATGKPQVLNADMTYDIMCRPADVIEIKSYKLAVGSGTAGNVAQLVDLKAEGQLHFPLSAGPHTVSVRSESVQADPLAAMASELPAQEKNDAPASDTSEETAGLLPADLETTVDFVFNRISYKDIEIAQLKGKTTIKDGKVKCEPLRMAINGAETRFSLNAQLSKTPISYTVDGNTKELKLEPLLAALAPKYAGTRGTVKKFTVSCNGKGREMPQLMEKMQADVSAEVRDLVLPEISVAKGLPGLNILAKPVQAIREISSAIPLNQLDADKGKYLKRARRVINKTETLKFSKGTMRLALNDGVVDIKECAFQGDPLSAVSVKGTTKLLAAQSDGEPSRISPSLDLEMRFKAGGHFYTIPIHGSLSAPVTDTKHLARKFAEDVGKKAVGEALNMLQNEGSVDGEDLLKRMFRDPDKKEGAEEKKQKSDEEKKQDTGSGLINLFKEAVED